MKTTTLTTADGREIRVHHAEDWSGQARLRFAPDSNQGDIHLPGWVARGLCRREPQCCADSRANLLARAEQAERERDEARAELERRKEELRLAQCPNPRDPKNGGHCDTCSGLSVARTRQLHEQEQRIAELKALNRDNLAMWEVERDSMRQRWNDLDMRISDIADEAFGPFPTLPPDDLLSRIEKGIFAQRQSAAEWQTKAEREADECERNRRGCVALCSAITGATNYNPLPGESWVDTAARLLEEARDALYQIGATRGDLAERARVARKLYDRALVQLTAYELEEPALRAQLAKYAAVVEAARVRLVAGCQSACGLYHTGPGSASFSRIFPEDTYPTNEAEADSFVKARMHLWFSTWIAKPMADALRALEDSGGSGAAPNPGEAASAIGNGPEPAGSSQNSPVGVAATAEDGHEAPARNRQPVEPPSDPATGTTRREPPETAIGGSTGAVACKTCPRPSQTKG